MHDLMMQSRFISGLSVTTLIFVISTSVFAAENPPNILWLITEDMGPELARLIPLIQEGSRLSVQPAVLSVEARLAVALGEAG